MDIDRHVKDADQRYEALCGALGATRIALWRHNWQYLQPLLIGLIADDAASIERLAAPFAGKPAPPVDFDPSHADVIARETLELARLVTVRRTAWFLSAMAGKGFEQSGPSAKVMFALSHAIMTELERETLWPFPAHMPPARPTPVQWDLDAPPLPIALSGWLDAMALKAKPKKKQ
jgi:hypothetical protein